MQQQVGIPVQQLLELLLGFVKNFLISLFSCITQQTHVLYLGCDFCSGSEV